KSCFLSTHSTDTLVSVVGLPNKRLKLAGADRFNGIGVLRPWRSTDCRPLLLRRRAGRPQLRRNPLGGRTHPWCTLSRPPPISPLCRGPRVQGHIRATDHFAPEGIMEQAPSLTPLGSPGR